MGIQTGSERLNFGIYNRRVPNQKVLKAAKLLSKHRGQMNPPWYDFIINSPFETRSDVLKTISLIRKIPKPFYCYPHNMVVFHGTRLCTLAKNQGLNIDNSEIHFHDSARHLLRNKKNKYLNYVVSKMAGLCTDARYGDIPADQLNHWTSEEKIAYYEKHTRELQAMIRSNGNIFGKYFE